MNQSQRNLVLFGLILLGSHIPQSGYADLIITGVFDGPLTLGRPKGIELFASSNVGDLSIYGVGSANNGEGTDGQEFTLSGSANAGEFLYVATESTDFASFFGFAPTYTSSAANINGNDAIELFRNGSVIDVFGDINVDGDGEIWDYEDGWAYRNDGTGPDGSTFNAGQWVFSGVNALDGETSNATASTPVPIGTFSSGVTPVPDPSSLAFAAFGACGIGARVWRRRRREQNSAA